MKLTGKMDLAKLTAGLEKYANQVGETGKDATARWSVQLCRELARQTQVFGVDRVKSYERQVNTIYKDFLNVVIVVPNGRPTNKRYLASTVDLIGWVKSNRRKGNRTNKLSYPDKKLCTQTTLNRAVEYELLKIGMAKGGWLGAGMFLAAEQTGLDRIGIGKSYIPWAYRNTQHGRGHMDKQPHHPTATLENQAAYTASSYVLTESHIDRAITWAGKNILTAYNKRIERLGK